MEGSGSRSGCGSKQVMTIPDPGPHKLMDPIDPDPDPQHWTM